MTTTTALQALKQLLAVTDSAEISQAEVVRMANDGDSYWTAIRDARAALSAAQDAPAGLPLYEDALRDPMRALEAEAAHRYQAVASDQSMFHRHAVVAGDGKQQLYLGREVECQNMAAKFTGAFLDGAFACLDMLRATPPAPQAAPTAQAPALVPLTDHHKLDNDQQVFFYEQDFYVLSNFSAFNLKFNGLTFPTSEHAYHYEKFAYERVGESVNDAFQRRNLAMSIKEAPSAHEAFKLAERWKGYRRADWDAVKVDIMREILRAKASQHEYVRRKLLETGDRELIEDSWRDDYWGWGPNRDGQNMLGKLWMEVRAGLRGITPAGTTPKEQQ